MIWNSLDRFCYCSRQVLKSFLHNILIWWRLTKLLMELLKLTQVNHSFSICHWVDEFSFILCSKINHFKAILEDICRNLSLTFLRFSSDEVSDSHIVLDQMLCQVLNFFFVLIIFQFIGKFCLCFSEVFSVALFQSFVLLLSCQGEEQLLMWDKTNMLIL